MLTLWLYLSGIVQALRLKSDLLARVVAVSMTHQESVWLPLSAAPEDWTRGFASPLERFHDLFHRAQSQEPFDPTAVVLATASSGGFPSARVVLLKKADEQGFMIVTNYSGRKGQELQANPRASLCFYYPTLNEQCRVEGTVEKATPEESDEYFQSRPRASQIGAWASQQSLPLDSRDTLLKRVAEYEKKFEGQVVPRPPHWGGFRIRPVAFEFWYDGQYRLHDRFRYELRDEAQWVIQRLYP